LAYTQNLTQTLIGTVLDTDSKTPFIGVAVVLGGDSKTGTVTDVKGEFIFKNAPLGRVSLQLSHVGYEKITIPDIEVNTARRRS